MTEDSLVSSMGTRGDAPDQEESGWTAYFEDFLSKKGEDDDQEDQEHDSPGSTFDIDHNSSNSPSLVSDATSSVPWEINNDSNNSQTAAACSPPKKLSFKKTRTTEISDHDDSLEDTASSPVNSPKVSSSKLQMDASKREVDVESPLGKGGGSHFCPERDHDQADAENEK